MKQKELKSPSVNKLTDTLISQTAKKTNLPESLVDKIVMSSLKEAMKAMATNNQVEFPSFGKFYVSERRLRKELGKRESMLKAAKKKAAINTDVTEKKQFWYEMNLTETEALVDNLRARLKKIEEKNEA